MRYKRCIRTSSCTRAGQTAKRPDPWRLLHQARLRRGIAQEVSPTAQSPLTGQQGGELGARRPYVKGLLLLLLLLLLL